MINRAAACCFSGHRKAHFDIDASHMGDIFKTALKTAITDAIAYGYNHFYTGMAMGFDIIAAEIVLDLKYSINTDISLIGIMPHKGHEQKMPKAWRHRHNIILRNADNAIILNPHHIQGCYQERNRHLVDHSSLLICLHSGKPGGTAHTHDYAQKSGLQIINLWPQLQ